MSHAMHRKKVRVLLQDFHGDDAIEQGIAKRLREGDITRFVQKSLDNRGVAEIRVACTSTSAAFPMRDIDLAIIRSKLELHFGTGVIYFNLGSHIPKRPSEYTRIITLTCEWK